MLQKRSRLRWWLITPGALLIAGGLVFWLTETLPQRELAAALSKIDSVIEPGSGTDHTATAHVALLRSSGLPKQFAGFEAELAISGPEHLSLATTFEKHRIELARNGQEIWIWEPTHDFGVAGEPDVPRFASAPDSVDRTPLGPMKLPIDRHLLRLLPRLMSVQDQGSVEVDGQHCRQLHAAPYAAISRVLKLPPASLTIAVRESDGWPVQIGGTDGRSVDVLLALTNLHVGADVPASRWQIPAQAAEKIQRVALSHITRFLASAVSMASSHVPELGPATGEQKLVATHGKGRLELRDGTRVLFVKGTPEEMGDQQGALLQSEVRTLVHRVLYGVGVGSSFAKNRWFFGEIEQCQSRLQPFIDPRDLREMDAMAAASGLRKEEVRLANFFPELFHCSGFALMGQATEGGRIYHGRVLDYLRGVGLESAAVVTVNQPDQGHAWVNIGYAGFIGSVTAMNDQRISMGEMGGRGEGHWDGKPMAELVREVMEKAGTLDEAIEILKRSPRTCEYFYVIADGKTHTAVGVAATPETLEIVHPGEANPRLPTPIQDAVLMSAGDRYKELVRRVQAGYGHFDADSARALMTRPVCMNSNIHCVLFAPDTLDFWVANADSKKVASAARYTKYNLAELLKSSGTSNP